MKRIKKKELERISMDRKIVEGLREGRSLTSLTKSTGKGKGYVIKIRDVALEYGYIELEGCEAQAKTFKAGPRPIPAFPEALFPLRDGRTEKLQETDVILNPKKDWMIERLELGWSP